MASNKFIALIFLFVSLMATPIAQAQLGGGGLLDVLGGLLGFGNGGLLRLVHINGNVSCSLDGSSSVVNGVATPAFPGALVQLQCGGNVVSSARTNSDGLFSMILDPVTNILSTLVNGCKVVVKTPLSTCNANLPSVGGLVSNIQVIGNIFSGLLNVANVIPGGFQFIQNVN